MGAAIMKINLGLNKIILNAVFLSSLQWKITWISVSISIKVWIFRFWSLPDGPEPSYLVKTHFSEKKSDSINSKSRAGPRLQNSTLWLAVKWHPKKIDVPTQLNRENQSKSWVLICWVLIPIWLPVWILLNFLFVHHL